VAEIVILGEWEEPVTIEDRDHRYPPLLLRGESALVPGTITGTITIGEGAEVTLGNHLTVSPGGSRGVKVVGGHCTLDGGTILGKAGVYVAGGDFTNRAGSIQDARAVV
jgi:hypothetical protein